MILQRKRAWFSVGYLLENPEGCISAYDRAISLKIDFAGAYNVSREYEVHTEIATKKPSLNFDEAIGLAEAGLVRSL